MMREIHMAGCRLMIDTADQNITDVNITDAVRKVAPYLYYVHFSDNEGQGIGLTHNILGHGTMNWKMFVKTLKEVGYTGFLTAQLYAGHPIDPDRLAGRVLLLHEGSDAGMRRGGGISFHSSGFTDYGIEQTTEILREIGYQAIELNMETAAHFQPHILPDLAQSKREEIRPDPAISRAFSILLECPCQSH